MRWMIEQYNRGYRAGHVQGLWLGLCVGLFFGICELLALVAYYYSHGVHP